MCKDGQVKVKIINKDTDELLSRPKTEVKR